MTQVTPKAMIEALHPGGKNSTRVNKEQYDVYRGLLESAVPKSKNGILAKELPAEVESRVPEKYRSPGGSCGWWVTTVRLDLEARGVLERIPGTQPLRVRKL